MSAVALLVLIVLLLTGMPVAFALWSVGLISVLMFDLVSLTQVSQSMYSGLDSFVLVAIPFFILAGNIMVRADIARPLFELMQELTRWVSGGAAMGASMASAAFGAMTGSSVASAAAMGRVTMPELSRLGYPAPFTAGIMAAGGTLGILIPPSLVLIIYGALAKVSVAQLFIAAVVPGIIVASLLVLTTYCISRRHRYGVADVGRVDPSRIARQLLRASPALLIPFLVVGGIYSGMFTPTEAAAVTAMYGLALGLLIYRRITPRDLPGIFTESVRSTAVILFILSGALFLGQVFTLAGVPVSVMAAVDSLGLSPLQFLLVMNVVILALGCFLDGFTLLTVLTPILLPSVHALGIDPIHFAIVLTLNIEVAAVTPPIGLNLFVISSVSRISVEKVATGVLPFTAVLIAALIMFTLVPELSLLVVG